MILIPIGDAVETDLYLNQLAGGGPGIFRGLDNEGDITERSVPDLTVDVDTFRGFFASKKARFHTKTQSPAVVAPTGGSPPDFRRIDRLEWTKGGGLAIITGVDSASPSPPSFTAGSIQLSQLHLRNGMTSIKDADDATNGFIVKERGFL